MKSCAEKKGWEKERERGRERKGDRKRTALRTVSIITGAVMSMRCRRRWLLILRRRLLTPSVMNSSSLGKHARAGTLLPRFNSLESVCLARHLWCRWRAPTRWNSLSAMLWVYHETLGGAMPRAGLLILRDLHPDVIITFSRWQSTNTSIPETPCTRYAHNRCTTITWNKRD